MYREIEIITLKQLSQINCSGAETFISAKYDNFDIQNFLKDFPPPKESTLKDFMSGKIGFFRLFIPKDKADFHVHFYLRIVPAKLKKNINVTIEFCRDQKHSKATTGKKAQKYSYYEDLFIWLKKYFLNFSKINIYSNIEYTFSNKKAQAIFDLPFPLEIATDQIGFKEINVSGLKLSLEDSKIGISNIAIDTDSENIHVYIGNIAKHFDEGYFDAIFESTSKLTNIFVKEL